MGDKTVDITKDIPNRDINATRSNAFYDMLTGQGGQQLVSNMGRIAGQRADDAVSPFGQSMQQLADLQSQRGLSNMEQRLASGGMLGVASGAANGALQTAMMTPYAEANAAIASKRADIYNSLYGQSMGNLANQSEQQLIAPQFQTQQGLGSKLLDAGMQLGGAWLGGMRKGG